MSVPVNQRGEGKLTVLVKANELAVYTIQICCNQNVFKPEYQSALTNDIISAAKDIFVHAWTANGIHVGDSPERAAERRRLQEQAITDCSTLLALIGIAHKLFHLPGKRVKYWGGLTIEVRRMLRAWRDSDGKRYKQ